MENLQLLDGTLEHRMSNVEAGLHTLNKKVNKIDKKIDHLGSVQMEMYDDQIKMGDEFRLKLEDQRQELKKWQKEIKKTMGGPCQCYITIIMLSLWFIFMIHYWWSL